MKLQGDSDCKSVYHGPMLLSCHDDDNGNDINNNNKNVCVRFFLPLNQSNLRIAGISLRLKIH